MYEQIPDDAAITRALGRWRDATNRPTRIAVVARSSSSVDPIQTALKGLGLPITFGPLYDSERRVTPGFDTAEIIIAAAIPITGPVFDQLACRMMLCPSVGYNGVNIADATARGIVVCNIPDAYSEEVALQAIAFLMAANRNLPAFEQSLRAGHWRDDMAQSIILHNPSVQTVGVIGFGRIGRIAATKAKALGFTVIATDPYVSASVGEAMGVPLVSLDEVLTQSDYITIHSFLWDETHHLINAERIAKMKRGAWIINTARGPIIDEAAMVAALQSGHLAGAGLDVFEVEPIALDNPLLAMPNVMVAPHIAVYSEEGRVRTVERAMGITRAAIAGHLPDHDAVVDKGFYDTLVARM